VARLEALRGAWARFEASPGALLPDAFNRASLRLPSDHPGDYPYLAQYGPGACAPYGPREGVAAAAARAAPPAPYGGRTASSGVSAALPPARQLAALNVRILELMGACVSRLAKRARGIELAEGRALSTRRLWDTVNEMLHTALLVARLEGQHAAAAALPAQPPTVDPPDANYDQHRCITIAASPCWPRSSPCCWINASPATSNTTTCAASTRAVSAPGAAPRNRFLCSTT
jgi:hypothetical protein